MNMRQFAKNHIKKQQMIPNEDRNNSMEICVLGLKWKISIDSIIHASDGLNLL